jgi:hypothetical protein
MNTSIEHGFQTDVPEVDRFFPPVVRYIRSFYKACVKECVRSMGKGNGKSFRFIIW